MAPDAHSLILAGECCAFKRHDYKKAIRLCERAYLAACRENNSVLEFRSLLRLIQFSFAIGKYEAILVNGGKAEYLAVKTKNYYELGHILRMKARALAAFGFYQESATELDRAMRVAELVADEEK
ncbi:hypothetical protein ACFOET_19540 [Parapedobacter deserti]|uniref:Tetratricopeptide repeat protein n=1 Tax=Parapedobacter deserti TaxID=1912957 RepID=A0ABV7JUL4_9SPHI